MPGRKVTSLRPLIEIPPQYTPGESTDMPPESETVVAWSQAVQEGAVTLASGSETVVLPLVGLGEMQPFDPE